jgi:hypothetical protein
MTFLLPIAPERFSGPLEIHSNGHTLKDSGVAAAVPDA